MSVCLSIKHSMILTLGQILENVLMDQEIVVVVLASIFRPATNTFDENHLTKKSFRNNNTRADIDYYFLKTTVDSDFVCFVLLVTTLSVRAGSAMTASEGTSWTTLTTSYIY